MEEKDQGDKHPPKRIKRSHEVIQPALPKSEIECLQTRPLLSLNRSITPPTPSRREGVQNEASLSSGHAVCSEPPPNNFNFNVIPSPFQLTYIRDISEQSGHNTDTVKLRDILGDPLLKECWQFNYLFDVDFLMNQFDADVRNLIQVKVVHGSWKQDSSNRIRIDEACSRYRNVESIVAYMPEPFGTHHSKMMVIIRHDDFAQVIIHTANMIPGDWGNMCQAVWKSPLLPLLPPETNCNRSISGDIGSGRRFKRDLLAYLGAYGTRKTGLLIEQLKKFSFDEIRAALVASIPSRQEYPNLNSQKGTLWGWPAVKDIIQRIPIHKQSQSGQAEPRVVVQVSSVASLGQTDRWLRDTFFGSLCPPAAVNNPARFSLIFPTPEEIRRSLNGYGSGGSIHMKLSSAAQKKQLDCLRPFLHHWAGDCEENESPNPTSRLESITTISGDIPIQSWPPIRKAGRRRAAPHIKTYIRFSDAETMNTIDWAMVTSANLSTQAWGAAANAKQEIRISSWEIGVMVWPDLFIHESQEKHRHDEKHKYGKESNGAKIVPCFRRDVPSPSELERFELEQSPEERTNSRSISTIIGLRMPYDLPLKPYSPRDMPWCATASHQEPDWLGQTWDVE